MAVAGVATVIAAISAGDDALKSVSGLYDSAMDLYGKFDGATEYKDRYRSLELSIINGSSHTLVFSKEHFDSGTWFTSPLPLEIPPGGASIAFVANRAGSVLCGVTGGLDYVIKDSGGFHLLMGFTNPAMGSYKNSIDVQNGKSAEWAYDNCEDDTVKRMTSNGYKLTCTMREPSRSPYKRFQYTIIDA